MKILREPVLDFKLLENTIYAKITDYISHENVINKESILQSVLLDVDIQFLWSMVAVDTDTEENSNELLRTIATMWITIRGHALASAFMEQYKEAVATQTKGAKDIRKSLKLT